MKKVSNKKVIRRITYRTMKEKKWKNLIAVLAIALTTLLFTALFTVGSSMLNSMQEATMRQVGTSAHGGYKYLSMEEYEKIKAAGGYKDISYNIVAGFGVNPELAKIQTEVRFSEDLSAKWSFCYPEEGSMPEEINECAASSKVLEALGVPLEPGSRVPLTISTHDADGSERILEEEFILTGFWHSNEASHAQEFWVSEKFVTENIDVDWQNKETDFWRAEGTVAADVQFESSFDITSQMYDLTERAGFSENDVRISVNWAYGAAEVDTTALLLGIGLLGIIILSGYLIIYNIFYINVTIDIRYYGLLKTIGTTGRQLRHMVRGQAFMLSAVGIPAGLLAGWFVGKGVLPVIYVTLNMGGVNNVVINPWIFSGAAFFALLVVYLSCIKPCRLAAKVSPIEAVRYVENTQYRKKEKKSAKVSPARLATANMGRNKKKVAVVIASLSLSFILLNATTCLVNGFSFDEYVKSYLLTDMQLSHYSAVNFSGSATDYEAVTPEVISLIENIPGVERVRIIKNKGGQAGISDEMVRNFVDFNNTEPEPLWIDEVREKEKTKVMTAGSYAIDEELFSFLTIEEGSFDKEKFEQGGYALLMKDAYTGWVNAGDKFTLQPYGEEAGPEKEMEIMAIVNFPYAISTRSYMPCGMRVLLCEKDFEELYDVKGALHACIDVEEGKDEQVKASLQEALEQNYTDLVLTTKDTLREEFAANNNMFNVVGGLLSFILAIIGILNLINAMITSILSRKQEFAMMQAVGMTGKQLKQMLTMEGIWYGIYTLVIVMTLGNIISYGTIYLMSRSMAYFEWNFQILPLLISIPVIAVVSLVLPVICYHTLCKKSIIERLRMAEV